MDDFGAPPPPPESVLQVPGARVVAADHGILREDFPHLYAADRQNRAAAGSGRPSPPPPRAGLEHWLVTHAAVVSEPQARQCVANTAVVTGPDRSTAYRPTGYGRAVVLPVHDLPGQCVGFLDVKGVGVAPGVVPGTGTHANGLLPLGEALREFLFQRLIEGVFAHAAVPFHTIPCYAVLALGFDIDLGGGGRTPAGLLVRRAHRRPRYRWGFKEFGSAEAATELAVELLLRRYGITSSGRLTTIEITRQGGAVGLTYGGVSPTLPPEVRERIADQVGLPAGTLRLEGINVQFAREVAGDPQLVRLVDFGGFRVRERFENPIVSLVSGRLFRIGTILRPHEPGFAQPDPGTRVPYELCGGTGGVLGFTGSDAGTMPLASDNSRILAYSLAVGFRDGALTAGEVSHTLRVYENALSTAIRAG